MNDLSGTAESVSVVLPHFEASTTLQRALESVANQSSAALEVIVVDDGSAQEERIAAQRIVDSYPVARLITLDRNAGPAHARNVGWDVATGDWVAFLDSDDAWHPKKIETQLEVVRRAGLPPQMVAGRTVQVTSQIELDCMPFNESASVHTISKRDLLIRNRMSTPSVMVRRDLELRFSSGRRFSEDYELWLSIAGLGHQVLFVEAPVAAIFKAPYGESGLSSQIWPMIVGEFQAYIGARRFGALNAGEMILGIAISAARATVRVGRLARRNLKRGSR